MDYDKLCFKDDLLNRKEFVINIMSVINNWYSLKKESASLSVSIDATWGSGKSYLVNMWKNWLISNENADKNYAVTYYNAWANDEYKNAFIPLLYSIQGMEVNHENSELIENVKKRTIEFGKSFGIAIIKDQIKKHIGENTYEILEKGFDKASEIDVTTVFDDYKKYLDNKESFRTALIDLIPQDGKLVVFVDELDRCRPTFAVETLEIVKHYFDIPNIVFIFSIDLNQLSHSISTLYGVGMDSSGYLRRFFDFNINIPKINTRLYVNLLFENFTRGYKLTEDFNSMVSVLYGEFNLSLRDMNKISDSFIVFCLFHEKYLQKYFKSDHIRFEIFLYFIILKYKFPQIYNLIFHQKFISYDNSPHHWNVLEKKFYVSQNISKMLKEIENGKVNDLSYQYIAKYGIE